MMNPRYQQQLIESYIKNCGNLYNLRNKYPSYYTNILETGNIYNTGLISLNIVNQVGKTPVNNATITVYVTDGMNRDIPIMHLITTINPVRIVLPMAYELGTQIVGPEYNFSTYNIRVDAFGYFANNVYNIRLFPNITTNFDIEMIPIRQLEAQPLIEERVDIPPHPRDVVPD